MSEYQVIARKWRPQSFADVVGQEHVVRTLRNAINSGRIAHAYLFVGPRGIGKTTLARIFAKALNCENPINGEPCCHCSSCQELALEKSLDVLEIDAASRNTTGDMRELAENALTRPVSGKYKIYIVDEVHMLSKQAWNVLLKTVEEPPAHVKFIFATTEVHQVLPTIISRCQRFDLMPIPTRLIAQRLQLIADTEKVAINPAAVNAIAKAAEGGMRDAQSLLDQMIAFFAAGDGTQITEEQVLSLFGLTDRGDLNAILQAVLRNNPGETVTRIAHLARRGKNLETLFDDILYALRAIQLCTIMPDPSEMIDESPEAIAVYRALAQQAPRDTIAILLENLAPVGRVLHDALNKQVYLETILLKAMREAHAVRISDILARLNQLRTADELKFLEQLPPVEKNFTVPAVETVIPVTPLPSKDEMPTEQSTAIRDTAEEKVAAAPVVEEPIQSASCESENITDEADDVSSSDGCEYVDEVGGNDDGSAMTTVAETVGQDVIPNDVSQAEIITETEAETTKENSAEIIPETTEEYSAEEDAEDDPSEYDTIMDDEFVLPDMARSSTPIEKPKESFSPDKLQSSIANSDPQALNRAKNDPLVQETLDLFSGEVIDIHR